MANATQQTIANSGINYPGFNLTPPAGAAPAVAPPVAPVATPAATPMPAPVSPVPPPVNTAQPSPTTANATPYTSSSFYLPTTPLAGYDPSTVFNDKGEALNKEQFLAQGGANDFSNVKKVSTLEQGLAAAKASGQNAPQTAGDAKSALKSFLPPTAPNTASIDAQLAVDPGYQQLLKDYAEYNSVANQTKSLTDTYQEMVKTSGLETINTELLNSKRIIEGTEEDIRNEVKAANGFATESQVQALSSARNKTLIKNYNNLVDQQKSIANQVSTMIGLASADREFALSSIVQKLQIDQQISQYRDKFVQNAKEGYNNIINAVGYNGLLEMIGKDEGSIALAEKTLGLGQGQLRGLGEYISKQQNLQNLADYNISTPYIITASGEVQNTDTGEGYKDPQDFQAKTGMTLDQAGQKGLIKPLGATREQEQQQFENQVDLAQLDLSQQGVNISRSNAGIAAGNLRLANEKFAYEQGQDALAALTLDDATIGKIQSSNEYKTISGLLPAVQAIKTYKDLVEKYGTYPGLMHQTQQGELNSAYGNAISAWKTLAGLGALSGADFGLAENAIPSLGITKNKNKSIATLQGSLDNAIKQASNLTTRLTDLYPKGNELLGGQLDNILVTAYPDKYKVGPDGKVYEITK